MEEEEAERMQELEDGGCAAKKRCLLDMTTSLGNPPQLWFPAQNGAHQHSIPTPSQVGGAQDEPPPQILAVNGCWGRDAILFSGTATDKLPVCQ